MNVGEFHRQSGLAEAAEGERANAGNRPVGMTWRQIWDGFETDYPWDIAPETEPLWRRLLGTKAGGDAKALTDAYSALGSFRHRQPAPRPAEPPVEGADGGRADILASIRRVLDEG